MSDGDGQSEMPDASAIPDAVQWHEGMVLTAQHFQQADRRHESLLGYHLSLSTPFHWGVRRIQIDPAALVGGLFRILELEAVLPDGTLVQHDRHRSPSLELRLDQDRDRAALGPRYIYLAIAARRSQAAATGRFASVDGAKVVDENTGEGAMQMPRLRPRPHLTVGARPSPAWSAMPIAQVAFVNEAFTLAPFVPPLVSVETNSELGGRCLGIAARLRQTAAFLSERIEAPAAVMPDARGLVLEAERQLRALVVALLPFEAVLYSQRAHPLALYTALCGIAGQVAAVGAAVPPLFDPYDHDKILASFAQVDAFIVRMLDQIRVSYAVVPFRYAQGVFSVDLSEGMIGETLIVGLRPFPGRNERELAQWMAGSIIGSAVHAQSMRERRVLGPSRERVDRVEELDLLAPRGTVLYRVDMDADVIERHGALTVFNTTTDGERLRPAEIILYVTQQERRDSADMPPGEPR